MMAKLFFVLAHAILEPIFLCIDTNPKTLLAQLCYHRELEVNLRHDIWVDQAKFCLPFDLNRT
jgi:hypothetical protein